MILNSNGNGFFKHGGSSGFESIDERYGHGRGIDFQSNHSFVAFYLTNFACLPFIRFNCIEKTTKERSRASRKRETKGQIDRKEIRSNFEQK